MCEATVEELLIIFMRNEFLNNRFCLQHFINIVRSCVETLKLFNGILYNLRC